MLLGVFVVAFAVFWGVSILVKQVVPAAVLDSEERRTFDFPRQSVGQGTRHEFPLAYSISPSVLPPSGVRIGGKNHAVDKQL